MPALIRLTMPLATLVIAGASLAQAESPMPDPIAPAVIGRPLDQWTPVRPAAPKVVRKPSPARPAAAQPAAAAQLVAAPAASRAAKQAVDDRADDPGQRVDAGVVGAGKRMARKPLDEGAYIAGRHRIAVRKYYEQHPVMRPPVKWKIGEPVPAGAVTAMVPRGVLAVLPPLPPGHQYLELGGEVVLVASGSKMVVDGVSRARDQTAQLSR